MGMPITSYTVLKTLALGGQNYELHAVEKAIKPFNLFAFIIHDPQAHPDFHQYLNEEFDRFDYTTGDKLLFFALIDPPQNWLRHARNRTYYQSISSWEARELGNPNETPKSTDPSLTAFTLANTLKIPTDSLPCIIVTDNLRSPQFLHFETSVNKLDGQMEYLGYIAKRYEGQTGLLDAIDPQKMGQGKKPYAVLLHDSIAKILSDFLSFVVASHDRGWLGDQAVDQAKQAINELYGRLDWAKSISTEEATTELDDICLDILGFFSLLNTQPKSNFSSLIPVDPAVLETDSVHILHTAYRVLGMLYENQSKTVDSILKQTQDWTPGVICLSKVFEKEINLSVVHWVRQKYGVALPQYFNRYQPGVQVQLERANFNLEDRRNPGRWLSPGIGQSEHACKKLVASSPPLPFTLIDWPILMSNWESIRVQRNSAAHTQIVDEASTEIVINALTNLAIHKLFDKLYVLKAAYRGA